MIKFIKLPQRPIAQAPRREPVFWRVLVSFLAIGATGASLWVVIGGDDGDPHPIPVIVRGVCALAVVLGLLLYRDAMTRKDL